MDNNVISYAEAGRILRLCRERVRQFVLTKRLTKVEFGGRVFVLRAEVEAMLSRRLAQNPPVGVSPDRGQAVPSKKVHQTSGDGDGGSPGAN